jgi:hypothetical protein
VLGFFLSGNPAAGAYLTELPEPGRGSGQASSTTPGAAWAFSPPLVGHLSGQIGLGHAIGIVAGCAFALVIVTLAFLPETRGKQLAVYH